MRSANWATADSRAGRRAVVLLCLAFAGRAIAAPTETEPAAALPTDPLLAQLIEQSLAARPELAQASAEVKAERERIPQAGALPDPMLQLGLQNDGFSSWGFGKMENSYFSIMASQTVPWPGKLRPRGELVELGADQAAQGIVRLKLSTEADVRRAYLGLVLARERLALLDRLEAVWQKSASVARTRYETGQGAQSDVLRTQLEQNRIRQRRWAMQADAATEIEALNRLRGHPLDEPIATSVHLVDLVLPTLREADATAEEALERSPELAAARLGVTRAEKAVALARQSYFPDLTLSLGVMIRGGPLEPMWLVSVGGPIPLYAGTKQSRAIAEAEARVVASQRGIEALEQAVRVRAHQRHTALGAVLETIRLYRGGLLVQSEATLNSTLSQYEVGKVTFASVLEASAGFISDEDGHLQAQAQAHRLEIDRTELTLGALSSSGTGLGSSPMPGAGQMGAAGPTSAPAAASPTGGSPSSSSSM